MQTSQQDSEGGEEGNYFDVVFQNPALKNILDVSMEDLSTASVLRKGVFKN